MRASELRTITEGVAGSLGRAVQKEVKFIDFLPSDDVLRYSVCGLATAALQRYLKECHDVQTTRIIIDLPERSPSMQNRHVFLRHMGSITIDPTYGQFFEYAGMSVIDTVERPELTTHYPSYKIAVVEDANVGEFITDIAHRAYLAGGEVQGESSSTEQELEQLYTAIWAPATAKRFPASDDVMVDRIVQKMNEVE